MPYTRTLRQVLTKYLMLFDFGHIKDARSVSLYPYNQSHILQIVKYIK